MMCAVRCAVRFSTLYDTVFFVGLPQEQLQQCTSVTQSKGGIVLLAGLWRTYLPSPPPPVVVFFFGGLFTYYTREAPT